MMRKLSVLLAAAGLIGTACATATGHLAGGSGSGTISAGSVTLLRLQSGMAAQPQAQPSLAPALQAPGRLAGAQAPQSRPVHASASASPALVPPDSSSASLAVPPTDRCVGSPNASPRQPQLMCAVP